MRNLSNNRISRANLRNWFPSSYLSLIIQTDPKLTPSIKTLLLKKHWHFSVSVRLQAITDISSRFITFVRRLLLSSINSATTERTLSLITSNSNFSKGVLVKIFNYSTMNDLLFSRRNFWGSLESAIELNSLKLLKHQTCRWEIACASLNLKSRQLLSSPLDSVDCDSVNYSC